MANKENLPPALVPAPISSISPSNKPTLNRQRDHSACRRPETPLKVRKTRENLKQHSIYADIPPPCLHLSQPHGSYLSYSGDISDTPGTTESNVLCEQEQGYAGGLDRPLEPQSPDTSKSALGAAESIPVMSRVQRQKSASRRMLSKVKQGIANRSKGVQSTRDTESQTSLIRRISGRRKLSCETDYCTRGLEISRASIDSGVDEAPHSLDSGLFVERSFTDSTVSTAEVFGDGSFSKASNTQTSYSAEPEMLGLSQIQYSSPPLPSSPSPQPTPRPPRKFSSTSLPDVPPAPEIVVPCVFLDVTQDCTTLDVHAKRDIWVAMKAIVRTSTAGIRLSVDPDLNGSRTWNFDNAYGDYEDHRRSVKPICGAVSSLRLGFKPKAGCRIRDVVGRKTMKDLKLGQECQLFIRLHVPKLRPKTADVEPDQESLFMELESIVGTLETEVLHVEARYQHSMLPLDNVVCVRHICKIQRPKADSRWSMTNLAESLAPSIDAQAQLARYLASECPSSRALELMQEYLDPEVKQEPHICEIRNDLAAELSQQRSSIDEFKPSVVVTDVDWHTVTWPIQIPEHFSTAPSTPTAVTDGQLQSQYIYFEAGHKRQPSSISLLTSKTLAPPLISAPKATIALSTLASQSSAAFEPQIDQVVGSEDRARQLWRHIRRSSLSTKQLEEMTSERLEHLEASDDTLKEIRRRALANKRSIGAETLKGWKWEGGIRHHERFGEAPWM